MKAERNALLCFPPSYLQTLVGSEKLQTEADLSVCLVILTQDRREGRDQEPFKKQQEEEPQMDNTSAHFPPRSFSLNT